MTMKTTTEKPTRRLWISLLKATKAPKTLPLIEKRKKVKPGNLWCKFDSTLNLKV